MVKNKISKSKEKKKMNKALKCVIIIVCVIAAIAAAITIAGNYKSNPSNRKVYYTTNAYITTSEDSGMGDIDISAHRSGGGIAPEETLMAFRNCAESNLFLIDVFEFDLHITKDEKLVLLHDDTLDRTSDCEKIFGEKNVKPEDKTYDELRQLNMGAKFKNEKGEMPYSELSGDAVPDDLRILSLDDVLDYLEANNSYKYIIEVKNEGDLGRKSVDILYSTLTERDMLGRVIFGTFHGEISEYVDENYPLLVRSTGIKEALEFWIAALKNDENYEPPCYVLQIPYCQPFKSLGINTATTTVVNYAHEHNIAVQYWTVNNEKDMEYLISIGADCIMTDYPDKLYKVKNEMEKK